MTEGRRGQPLDRLEWRRVSRRPEMRSIAGLQRSVGNRVVARLLERTSAEAAAAAPFELEESRAEPRGSKAPRARRVVPAAVGAAAGGLLLAGLAAAGEHVTGGIACILAIAAGLLIGRMLARV